MLEIPKSITRRQFCCGTSGMVAALWSVIKFYEIEYDEPLPEGLFRDIWNTQSPAHVAATFASATTPTLMASYGCFFPRFIRDSGREAVDKIANAAQEQKQKCDLNPHRLDALPAVCAAHRLPVTNDSDERARLSNVISKALSDPRREVLQIVTQNLVSAVAPNQDSVRFFFVDRSVLTEINRIIIEAERNPKLLTAASICVQFILNARALLARSNEKRLTQAFDDILSHVSNSKSPDYWYLNRLAQLHVQTFHQVSSLIPSSLPPQYEEALMGWKSLPKKYRAYLAHLALIKCRQTYIDLGTADGRFRSDEAMTSTQAEQVLPKSVSFVREFDLQSLLKNLPSDYSDLPIERGLSKFLNTELPALVKAPSRELNVDMNLVQPTPLEIRLAERVPFAQYDSYDWYNRFARSDQENDRRFLVKLFDTGVTTALAGVGAYVFLNSHLPHHRNQKLPNHVIEGARADAEEAEHYAQSCSNTGVDQQQEQLGDIPFAGWRI